MNKQGLSASEIERYTRQLALPHIGQSGQLRLKRASALVVGLGGLGCVSSLYLTLAGFGTIGLIEADHVSLDNLHRQTLYTTDDIGESKLPNAIQSLEDHNPEGDFITYPHRLAEENASSIISNFELVIDGTDNLETRQVINKTCVELDKPYIFGAVNLYDGQVSVFHASRGPCMGCLFPSQSPNQDDKPAEQLAVLNTMPAVIGALQATEAIKITVGVGVPLIGQLLIYNALNAVFERVAIEKNPSCPVCGR